MLHHRNSLINLSWTSNVTWTCLKCIWLCFCQWKNSSASLRSCFDQQDIFLKKWTKLPFKHETSKPRCWRCWRCPDRFSSARWCDPLRVNTSMSLLPVSVPPDLIEQHLFLFSINTCRPPSATSDCWLPSNLQACNLYQFPSFNQVKKSALPWLFYIFCEWLRYLFFSFECCCEELWLCDSSQRHWVYLCIV